MSPLPTLLAVDDAPENLELIREALRDRFQVVTAENARAALQLAAKYRPRVAVIDVKLPDHSGIDLCRAIRCTPTIKNTAIFMVSALTQESDLAAGYAAGADAYLGKPLALSELTQELEQYAARPHESEEARRISQALTVPEPVGD